MFIFILLGSYDNVLTTCKVEFNVNSDIYLGFLINDTGIIKASKNRQLIYEVEKEMSKWIHQIQYVINLGHQITKDYNDSGPLVELEYWRKMLVVFSHVTKFIQSKIFRNYYKCLKLSKSKLIAVRFLSNNLIWGRFTYYVRDHALHPSPL